MNKSFNIKLFLYDYVVKCQNFSEINNGNVECTLGRDGVYSYEDTCTITCNSGYTLIGSDTRRCLSDGSWSNSVGECRRGKNCLLATTDIG